MLRAGAIILTFWSAFNLLLALSILSMILALHKNAPALIILFGDAQASGMDPRALATVNALAVIFNACAAAFCCLSLVVIWQGLMRRAKWAFWSLAATFVFLQASGFASDALLNNHDLLANAASSAVLLLGLTLSAKGLFR